MTTLRAWIAGKGGLNHLAALAFVFLMAAYAGVPQFHSLVIQIHQSLPGWAQDLLTTAAALWAFYRKTQKANPAPPAQPGPIASIVLKGDVK